jgi:hypothetical protein
MYISELNEIVPVVTVEELANGNTSVGVCPVSWPCVRVPPETGVPAGGTLPKIVVPSELAATFELLPFFELEELLELEPQAATASAVTIRSALVANARANGFPQVIAVVPPSTSYRISGSRSGPPTRVPAAVSSPGPTRTQPPHVYKSNHTTRPISFAINRFPTGDATFLRLEASFRAL